MAHKYDTDEKYAELKAILKKFKKSFEGLLESNEDLGESNEELREHIALLTEAVTENTESNHGVEIMLENLITTVAQLTETIKNYSLNQ